MRGLASVQATTLDIVWIRGGLVCLGVRPAERCYRAVLIAEGPPEAFATEVERVQPLLDGYAQFLNALSQPGVLPPSALQIVVRAEPADLAEYAQRLDARAGVLPPHLAREALADAAWARQQGPTLGLIERRSYVVVPAEPLSGADLGGRLGSARSRVGRWLGARPPLDEGAARRLLETRCDELVHRLSLCGVWAERMDDIGLARLLHACWSRRRDGRFEHDLRACVQALPGGRS